MADLETEDLDFGEAGTAHSLRAGDLEVDLEGDLPVSGSRHLEDDRLSVFGDECLAGDELMAVTDLPSVGLPLLMLVAAVRLELTAGLLERLFLPKKRLSLGVLCDAGVLSSLSPSDLPMGTVRSMTGGTTGGSAVTSSGVVYDGWLLTFLDSSSGSEVEAPLPGNRFSVSLSRETHRVNTSAVQMFELHLPDGRISALVDPSGGRMLVQVRIRGAVRMPQRRQAAEGVVAKLVSILQSKFTFQFHADGGDHGFTSFFRFGARSSRGSCRSADRRGWRLLERCSRAVGPILAEQRQILCFCLASRVHIEREGRDQHIRNEFESIPTAASG